MKFAHLIPVPNADAFDLHLHKLKTQTESYLKNNGHTVDHFILGPEYDQHGWCEELIYFFTTTGRLDSFDYLIFSHSDILIEEFIFLDFIDRYAFGRPFYFVISIEELKKLCKIQVKYHLSSSQTHMLESIFHGEKVKDKQEYITCLPISFDSFKFHRKSNADHSDHIFYLNAKNMLYPPLERSQFYDKNIDKLYHFTGVGVGSDLLYSQTHNKVDFLWRLKGLINYCCHKFRSEDFSAQEIKYMDNFISYGINNGDINKILLQKMLTEIAESDSKNFKVGIQKNYKLITRWLTMY